MSKSSSESGSHELLPSVQRIVGSVSPSVPGAFTSKLTRNSSLPEVLSGSVINTSFAAIRTSTSVSVRMVSANAASNAISRLSVACQAMFRPAPSYSSKRVKSVVLDRISVSVVNLCKSPVCGLETRLVKLFWVDPN